MSLRMGIVGLLKYAPMSGYALKKVFDMSINHIWSANLSQIYRELRSLEEAGLVTSDVAKQESRPDKKVYAVTEKGRKEFNSWLNRYPVAPRPARRDEFLLRIFFGSEMDRTLLRRELEDFVRTIEGFRELIREDRLQLFSELLDRMADAGPPAKGAARSQVESKYWRFTVRRFEMVAEASVRWAEECLREMEERA